MRFVSKVGVHHAPGGITIPEGEAFESDVDYATAFPDKYVLASAVSPAPANSEGGDPDLGVDVTADFPVAGALFTVRKVKKAFFVHNTDGVQLNDKGLTETKVAPFIDAELDKLDK